LKKATDFRRKENERSGSFVVRKENDPNTNPADTMEACV
jgi:hypothetical protein